MSRKIARDTVYKMLFASRFFDNMEDNVDFEELLNSASENKEIEAEDRDYITKTFNGVIQQKEKLTALIMSKITGYKLERIIPTDLTAMLLAVYELENSKSIPAKVVASEAVDLVKKYSTEKSTGFVNGILSSIIKDMNE